VLTDAVQMLKVCILNIMSARSSSEEHQEGSGEKVVRRTLSLDPEVAKLLEEGARRERRKVNNYIEWLIAEDAKRNPKEGA
jgi:hypothetical protein